MYEYMSLTTLLIIFMYVMEKVQVRISAVCEYGHTLIYIFSILSVCCTHLHRVKTDAVRCEHICLFCCKKFHCAAVKAEKLLLLIVSPTFYELKWHHWSMLEN